LVRAELRPPSLAWLRGFFRQLAPEHRQAGELFIANNVSTDVVSTMHEIGTWVNAQRSAGNNKLCLRVCMSNYPEGQSCPDCH
jgi:hypothetical protein